MWELEIFNFKTPIRAVTRSPSGGFVMKLKDYFPNFLEYMRKEGLKEHTINEHRRFLYGALGHCPIKDKRIKDLKLTDRADVVEAGKVHGEYGPQRAVVTLRRFLKFLYDDGVRLPFNWEKIKVPPVGEKEQDYLTEKEFNEFVGKIPLNTLYGLRDRTLYEVLFSTGARIGEILSLKRDKINWPTREAKIKTEKTGDEGLIYFSERSLTWLKRYLDTRADNNAALFVTYHPEGIVPLFTVTARKHLISYRKKFEISKKITHHCFRRSLATLLLEEGATIKEVQYLMRHKSERTTLKFYTKVNKRKAKEVHQRILDKK